MIYALGDVSGANFNPAVTLAIYASKMYGDGPCPSNPKDVLKYMIVQVLGGICASWTYKVIYHGYSFPLAPQPGHQWSQVAVAEVIFTFVLCYVVLCVACHEKTKSTSMFGLAIGSCVTVGGFAIGSISGGSLNPAVSFGISVSRSLVGHTAHHLGKACSYSFFEFVGAAIAAGVLSVTHKRSESDKSFA